MPKRSCETRFLPIQVALTVMGKQKNNRGSFRHARVTCCFTN
uniref:Uncharacterized protein n=1 Tax=Arundo donax TaxID=35708 RepID=A0A0A8Y0S2_ARUDO